MPLNKVGSPQKLKIVKNAGFTVDVDALAELFLKQWPEKQVTIDQIHNGIKSIGVNNYSSEDLSELMGRLQAIGFSIK